MSGFSNLSGHQNHWAIQVTHTDYKTHYPGESDSVGLGKGPGTDPFLQDPHRIFMKRQTCETLLSSTSSFYRGTLV